MQTAAGRAFQLSTVSVPSALPMVARSRSSGYAARLPSLSMKRLWEVYGLYVHFREVYGLWALLPVVLSEQDSVLEVIN